MAHSGGQGRAAPSSSEASASATLDRDDVVGDGLELDRAEVVTDRHLARKLEHHSAVRVKVEQVASLAPRGLSSR